ncbi:MAG: hypothetical protein ACREJC_05205 [Tepidisphaeraceae bacterium]
MLVYLIVTASALSAWALLSTLSAETARRRFERDAFDPSTVPTAEEISPMR